MAVLLAVKGDLARAGANAEVLAAIERILVTEVPVRRVEVETAADAAKRKKARKIYGREAIRAEIEKDAGALLEATGAHEALARRRWDPARIEAMRREAAALGGLLGERAVQKGAAKAATTVEHAAVVAQKAVWGASYRMLAAVGRRDARVQQLLSEAASQE